MIFEGDIRYKQTVPAFQDPGQLLDYQLDSFLETLGEAS